MTTFVLKDLEGRPGLTTAHFVRTRTEAMRLVRQGKTVTAAGAHGAINIWRDRQHRLNAAFCRHLVYLNHTQLSTLTNLNSWLRTWWPQLSAEEEVAQ